MNKLELVNSFNSVLNDNDVNDNSLYPNSNKGGDFKSVETLIQEILSPQREALGMGLLEQFLPKDKKDFLLSLL